MKLEKKKAFAAKVLGVGKDRITFNTAMLADIKEAITRQDVRDLFAQKAIIISEINGRKTHITKKTRRRVGSVRKRVIDGKRKYITLTRKLRAYLMHLKMQGKIPQDKYQKLRTEIRASAFHSLAHFKEMGGLK